MIFLRQKSRQPRSSNSFNNRISINERLASIGGLFGALSIIITGALLYAIFTARSEDKWYYITAVLINVFLLLLLMIGAIIFDRYYLKRWANVRTIRVRGANNQTAISSTTGRDQTTFHNSDSTYDTVNFIRNINDVPPQYPGYYPTVQTSQQQQQQQQQSSAILTADNGNSTTVVSYMNTDNCNFQQPATVVLIAANSTNMPLTIDNDTYKELRGGTRSADLICENDKITNSAFQPPNYYELYPSSSITPTDKINSKQQLDANKNEFNEIICNKNEVHETDSSSMSPSVVVLQLNNDITNTNANNINTDHTAGPNNQTMPL